MSKCQALHWKECVCDLEIQTLTDKLDICLKALSDIEAMGFCGCDQSKDTESIARTTLNKMDEINKKGLLPT